MDQIPSTDRDERSIVLCFAPSIILATILFFGIITSVTGCSDSKQLDAYKGILNITVDDLDVSAEALGEIAVLMEGLETPLTVEQCALIATELDKLSTALKLRSTSIKALFIEEASDARR